MCFWDDLRVWNTFNRIKLIYLRYNLFNAEIFAKYCMTYLLRKWPKLHFENLSWWWNSMKVLEHYFTIRPWITHCSKDIIHLMHGAVVQPLTWSTMLNTHLPRVFFFFFIIYFFEHSSKSSCIHSELFLHFYPKQNQTKNQQISKALMMILCFPSRTSGYGLMDPGSTTTPGATW